ncbi:MAG: sulfurtransferase [Lentisphaerae bacterium RIFOXYA12_FULL_48_11]|nr:MAG: sulfurtransferase [Lentisphaerae bacterium RIFOXYA12_FULL_48_11]
MALLIGCGFGFALERAGFSSSRRLAGVFYFKDMAVVKVMFSGLITAMLGLSYLVALGLIKIDQVFLMPTIYGAQIIGGLLFGVGFAMGAWCPGTAAAGLAAGRLDALVFLAGSVGGSIIFNELFPVIGALYTAGDQGPQMVYNSLGMSRNAFILMFTVVAVGAFWLAEWAEKARTGRAPYLGTPFLKAFSLALVAIAAGLFVLSPVSQTASAGIPSSAQVTSEKALLENVDNARDHIEPEELADRLMAGQADLVLVDVRSSAEFEAFHIRGAVNIQIAQLAETLQPHRNKGLIVLYSNGMTHPAQARDALQRLGFDNVYILTDGLQGFRDRCLKPVSLRSEPVPTKEAMRINAWRAFFTGQPQQSVSAGTDLTVHALQKAAMPGLVDGEWLASRLDAKNVKIIDLRPQPEYNTAHIPGSLSLNVESLRGNLRGVPSMLLPSSMLAEHFSMLGIQQSDVVILVSGEKFHDDTLAGMALERVGHLQYVVLNGGYATWLREGRPVDAALPMVKASKYQAGSDTDSFTIDYQALAAMVNKPGTVIIDVRPAEFYTGSKSDEARAGHIPGAINRPYTEDILVSSNKVVSLKPAEALVSAYAQIIPSKNMKVVVHCRTGHQASQTYFVLKRLLGYTDVSWYDAGWTEWAARLELPVVR